ncbi:DUF3524 domain-containing protein [Mariprofundus sp. KV]|uniref:tRNA-queuosine alpha-mannosyltransferase domain-containing protein n=1 Tax=Mariprofundus sp. KV TaxID=2608715 RepID=UPI0015A08EB4|nr:DUF3524 domain-containing protein [Mariprofundus sp. KV]NWF35321.1 DUF3524 domain-containing protein [Mariprofundus sp. KV]
MRILLLSAYDAASHRQWRLGLAANLPQHQWTVLTLPDRFFSWRIRGNALSWIAEQQDLLQQTFDLIIATSMVDLATLKGLQPNLAAIPSLLYFHENQFAYPESGHAHSSVEAQITSIYSAMAADRLLFNSAYNRKTFLHGAKALLKKMPDHAPLSVITALEAKSSELPVPVDDICFRQKQGSPDEPVILVWNHRWEYDKGPDRLHLLLKDLMHRGVDFRIHLLGQRFRRWPEAFDHIKEVFKAQILSWGYIEDRNDYLQVLQKSDIVFSTALHDFQGLAMQEAIACGCTPVAPNRLAYPEYIPANCLSGSYPEDPEQEASAMVEKIIELQTKPQQLDITHRSWSNLADRYEMLLHTSIKP